VGPGWLPAIAADGKAVRGAAGADGLIPYLLAAATAAAEPSPWPALDLIDHLRAVGVSIIYDPATRALRTDARDSIAVTVS
jgi:hypothetical protein